MEMNPTYVVVFEADEEGWTASVPDLPGCFSDGPTLDDTKIAIAEAIRLWLDAALRSGRPIPPAQAQAMKIAV